MGRFVKWRLFILKMSFNKNSVVILLLTGLIISKTKIGNVAVQEQIDMKYAFAQICDGSTVTEQIDLNGPWQFKATDEEEWKEALVPSTVWTDLLRNGRLVDPFYRDNELKVQWIEKKEWEYRRTFHIDENFLKHDKIILDCRGLDTIAEIYLNGTFVTKTINMFIEYEFDVKPFLKAKENQIHIIFRNILEWIKEQNASEPKVIWKNSKGNSFFARKEGSGFGWNWGVRLLTCGIWRSIRLAAYDIGRIVELGVRQNLNNPKNAILDVNAEIQRYIDEDLKIEIQVIFNGKTVAQKITPVSSNKVSTQLTIKDPKLWWPNGWGDQPLYKVVAKLRHENETIHQKHVRIGLRTFELIREKDERGETFGFKVNGHLIFCKGANWIPADALPDRLTENHYRHLLQSCVEVNMNMVRLWGGGLYEPNIFYEFCDENGLMIWHDFMFAVGPYIANDSYMKNVRNEIANVVRRLRHHPSIVLWCGNNEQESNMGRNGGWTESYETVTWNDYDQIFNELIPNTVALHDPERPYWPSSPHHPLDRERDSGGFEAQSGDAHVWDVWHGGYPISWFEDNYNFRFVSEYGFASYPTMATIRSFTASEDRHFGSYVLEHHHKERASGNSDYGDTRIARNMAKLFGLAQGFENFVYVSHIMHGECMKIATEAFRRNYPHTTGALYWQVNENWPNTCKSGLDYYGRWKANQYMARHYFNPILVSGKVVDKSKVKIWGVNDLLEDVPVKLDWILARFDGTEVKSGDQKVILLSNTSTFINELDFTDEVGENPAYHTYRKESYEQRRNYYISYKLVQGDKVLSSNIEVFVPYKYLALQGPLLKHKIEKDDNSLVIEIAAEKFAAFVELGLKNSYARFSDNYFHLLPGEMKKIEVVESEISNEEFMKQFYAKSLIDSYR